MKKSTCSILLLFVSLLSLIFAIVMFASAYDFNLGKNGEDATFGADFYTIINENAYVIANNTHYTNCVLSVISRTISKGFGFAFLITSFVLAIKALSMFFIAKNEKAANNEISNSSNLQEVPESSNTEE